MPGESIPFSNLSLSIKFSMYCKHDIHWTEHKTKADYTLWNVREGSLILEINRHKLTAKAGDVLLFYPGDSYKAYANGCDCNFLVTFFSLETGNHIDLLEQKNYAGIYRHPDITEASSRFFEEFSRLPSQPQLNFLQYASFLNFFAALSRHFGTQIPFSQNMIPNDTSDASRANLRIHRLLAYMNEHFTEPLTNRDLAAFMGMSEKYFISYFHIHIGKSPKQYLIECRMRYSLILLKDPRNTIADIALRLNFTDQYSFSKAFKKYYGEAPSTFRKQLR